MFWANGVLVSSTAMTQMSQLLVEFGCSWVWYGTLGADKLG